MDPVKYSDLIQPDDSLTEFIRLAGEVKTSLVDLQSTVKRSAEETATSLKKTSGATAEGRQEIKKSTDEASRLSRAQKELALATSDVGAKIQELKVLTAQANSENRTMAQYVNTTSTSYANMKAELKAAKDELAGMSAQQVISSTQASQLIARVLQLQSGIKDFDEMLRQQVVTQKEANQTSSEATSLNAARTSELAKQIALEERLAYAKSDENRQSMLLNAQIREATQVSKLEATINSEKEGSYNSLSAQYSLNKIRLNAMSDEERKNVATGGQLEKQTLAIRESMIKMQEATGMHTLSVGNYGKAWDGLGMSVNQIVRELPSAAISMNTFFLAISNNVPIMVDEIQRLRMQNKAAIAEGKPTSSVVGGIASSLFSMNTMLILVLTAFSMYGKQIVDFVGSLAAGDLGILTMRKELANLQDELANDTSYGSQVTKIKSLSAEWKALAGDAKGQKQWIYDNQSEFKNLNVSVLNVNEAYNVFVKNTAAVIESLALRAKATAAMNLASKSYESAMIKKNEEDLEKINGKPWYKKALSFAISSTRNAFGSKHGSYAEADKTVANLFGGTSKELESEGDKYIKLFQKYTDQADNILSGAGIDTSHRTPKKAKAPKKLTDETIPIMQTSASVQKKYEESITALERDEFVKRRQEAMNTYNSETRELGITYEKNKKILNDGGKHYKKLSKEQIATLNATQNTIVETVKNKQLLVTKNLEDIEKDRQVSLLQIDEQTTNLQLETTKKGSEQELKLKQKLLNIEMQIAIIQNSKKAPDQQLYEGDIISSYQQKGNELTGSTKLDAFSEQQTVDANVFNEVQRNEYQVNKFKLAQEKALWEEKLELAKNGQLKMSDAEKDAAVAAIKDIDKESKKLDKNSSILDKLGFTTDQQSTLKTVAKETLTQLSNILQSDTELAQVEVDTASKKTQAAQSTYDAEVTARANGYANNVATAKKQLETDKKNQKEKEKLLVESQNRQEALNTITQTSSLITASAELWKAFATIPILGPALAIAAIGTMWTSFAVAKVKARQVTKAQANASTSYGEGGLEFLEGGSHSSGNDIPIGRNRKGMRKAEGGEALAVINKRNTNKYRKVLPDVIKAFNRGVFEEKYGNIFDKSGQNINLVVNSRTDVSRIENSLVEIKKQNASKIYTLPDGTVIEIRGNVKRIIRG